MESNKKEAFITIEPSSDENHKESINKNDKQKAPPPSLSQSTIDPIKPLSKKRKLNNSFGF